MADILKTPRYDVEDGKYIRKYTPHGFTATIDVFKGRAWADEIEPVTVAWSSFLPMSPAEAEVFAEALAAAVEYAKSVPEPKKNG